MKAHSPHGGACKLGDSWLGYRYLNSGSRWIDALTDHRVERFTVMDPPDRPGGATADLGIFLDL